MKSILYTVVALLTCTATVANASEYNLGSLAIGTKLIGNSAVAETFEDFFAFSIPTTGRIIGSILDTPDPWYVSYETVFTSFSLHSNMDGIIGNADDSIVTAVSIGGGTHEFKFSTNSIAAGNYFLVVDGVSDAPIYPNHGYWGYYKVAVSAVPEPETWAMMMVGLGLVGALAHRRQAR